MVQRIFILIGLCLVFACAQADPLINGNADAGAKTAAVCAACHGQDGNSTVATFPKLAGQHATYIYEQLKEFKSGKRQNPVMQGMAAGLSEQNMKDVAVYYSQQTTKPGVADKALVKKGALIYRSGIPDSAVPSCSGCHGPAGLGNAAANYPRLSGQHATYVAEQLKAFRDGTRSSGSLAKIMDGVAKNLSDKDIKALASYVSGLKPRGN